MNDLVQRISRLLDRRGRPTTRQLRGRAAANESRQGRRTASAHRRTSRGELVAKALGAAALTFPVGLWLGGRLRARGVPA